MKLKLFISIPVLFYLLLAIIYTDEKPVYITYTIIDKTSMAIDRMQFSTGLLQSSNPNLQTEDLKKVSANTYTFKQRVILRRKPLLFYHTIKNEPKLLMLLIYSGTEFKNLKANWAYKALKRKKYKYELYKSDIVKANKFKS